MTEIAVVGAGTYPVETAGIVLEIIVNRPYEEVAIAKEVMEDEDK